MLRTGLALLAVGATIAAGSGGTALAEAVAASVETSAAPASTTELARVDLVVIGDSLIDPSHCPGCTGFVEQYASYLGDVLAVPSAYHNVVAMGVPEAVQVVADDETSRAIVADAEVVVVQTGFNNALPDPTTGIGCGGSLGTTNDEIIDWTLSTEPECLAEGIVTYGQLYDQIFAGIKELRAGQPTVFIVTNTIDGNIDPSLDGLLLWAKDRVDEELAWILASYERWNQMIAERAEAAGFELVDIWHEFNGPDGTAPCGDLAVDGAHPSQAGNDLIAAMLAEVDVSTLGGQQAGS